MGSRQAFFRCLPVAFEDELVIWPKLGVAAFVVDEFDQRTWVGERVLTQRQDNTLRACLDLFNIRRAAETFDLDDLEQELDFLRQLAKPVDELCGDARGPAAGADVVAAPSR